MQFIGNTGINAHGAPTAICKYAQDSTNRSRPHACSQLPWPKVALCLLFQLLQEGAEGGAVGQRGGGRLCGVPAGALLNGRLQAVPDMYASPFCFV